MARVKLAIDCNPDIKKTEDHEPSSFVAKCFRKGSVENNKTDFLLAENWTVRSIDAYQGVHSDSLLTARRSNSRKKSSKLKRNSSISGRQSTHCWCWDYWRQRRGHRSWMASAFKTWVARWWWRLVSMGSSLSCIVSVMLPEKHIQYTHVI